MNKNKVIDSISIERFQPYLSHSNHQDVDALKLYEKNIDFSKSFYSLLSVLEVTLRNKIDNSCKEYFNSNSWLQEYLPPELLKQIVDIEIRLEKSKREITNSRILAELNFGYWTTMFNRKYAKLFWKPLHQIFPNMPKRLKKRSEIASRLNRIRVFRNRVYHYEPIIWNTDVLNKRKTEILEVIYWLDSDTSLWAQQFDEFDVLIKKYK